MIRRGLFLKNGPQYNPFIFEVTVNASDVIPLPLTNGFNYNFTVDWGDGNQSDVTAHDDVDASHTYTSGGTYEIKINGVCESFRVGNNISLRTKITKITQWGSVGFTAFNMAGCSLMTITATDIFDTSLITSFTDLFSSCSSISSIPNINSWDVSKVTNFLRCFISASNFNDNIGSWDVSSCSNFQEMFDGASSFNNGGSDTIKDWDVSKGSNFVEMFRSASSFNQPLNWSFKTSGTISAQNMFRLATNFNQNIGSWNTERFTNMREMFKQSSVFNQDLSNWDISLVTNMIEFARLANFSDANWDSMLNAWAALTTPPSNITMTINATHTAAAQTAFDTLDTTYNWSIGENNVNP